MTDHRPDPFDDEPATDLGPEATIARLERRAARERAARLEAEVIAENQLRRSYERSREVELFASIAVLVNESRDALSALGAAAKVLRRHCDFAVSHVLVPDADGAFVTADIWDADPGALEFLDLVMGATVDERFDPPRGLPGEVAASHLALWLPDLSTAANYPRNRVISRGSSWAFPVVTGVEVRAVIEFVHPEPRPADERLLQLAPSIGGQLGRAFEWEALEERQRADRRRLEELLAQRTEEANSLKRENRIADDARSAYLAYLGHEADAALHGLRALAERDDAPADSRAALDSLVDTLGRLTAVADGGSRRILGERTAVALDVLVDGIVGPYAASPVPVVAHAERLGPDFVTSLQTPLVLRAARELVDNALAHSGTDRVEVGIDATPDMLVIEVRDHGTGYTWPGNGSLPQGGGGLAQTSRLTTSLGGSLDVSAHPDGGTCAQLRIAARSGGTAAWVARSTRVLLVDDNEINRRLAAAMLGKIGLDTDVVDGGEAALDSMARSAYGLVLMDVQMPGIDGRETTRRWRAGQGGATAVDVPIVALTAHVGQAERDSCRDAGMTDYLSKPFGIDALADMARTYLDPRQAEADPAR
ncbi:MAG: response regulator [Candidatus Nanopelagicales bacterium]